MDLFTDQRKRNLATAEPLPVRMRPRTIDEFVGQRHFLGEGKLLRRALAAGRLASMIFYGPAGTGKTSLAQVIAASTGARFERVNAAETGVKEVRAILDKARGSLADGGVRTVLFVDELHRFNKGQQDVLLKDVEEGVVILVGATTENPFYAVNAPLISRSQIFQFEPLSLDDIKLLMRRALADIERGMGRWRAALTPGAEEHLAVTCDGDARRALTALEIAVLSQAQKGADGSRAGGRTSREGGGASRDATDESQAGVTSPAAPVDASGHAADASRAAVVVDLDAAVESIQRKAITYDKTGDAHYDAISAMIKSIRGSDPDAAVYWLARMLEAGEDPRYVARRIVIAAAEDIGNADPRGLVLAQTAADATAMIGMPECQLPLAQAVTFLSCCPKSNAAAKAIWEASTDVREGRTIPVPVHLRSSEAAKRVAAGGDAGFNETRAGGARSGADAKQYKYPHDSPDGIIEQDYLGVEKRYYVPTGRGVEKQLGDYLAYVRRVTGRG